MHHVPIPQLLSPPLTATQGIRVSLFRTIAFIVGHPLNRGRPLSSIIRYVRWQFGSRLAPGKIVYEWINGSRFLVKPGEKGLTGNIYTGLHEFSGMGFVLHFLRPDDLFVDIGANSGSYTVLACAVIGSRGIAFEPVPCTYKKLIDNVHINHLGERVRCVNQAVAATPGLIAFTNDRDTTNRVVASGERCADQITVEATCLDVALRGENPALMKIDVEGFEVPVLEGAAETLRNRSLNAVILELNGCAARYGFDESAIIDLMRGHGFGTYAYDPLNRMLSPLGGKNLASGNTLFVRDVAFVEDRLRGAPRIAVAGRHL